MKTIKNIITTIVLSIVTLSAQAQMRESVSEEIIVPVHAAYLDQNSDKPTVLGADATIIIREFRMNAHSYRIRVELTDGENNVIKWVEWASDAPRLVKTRTHIAVIGNNFRRLWVQLDRTYKQKNIADFRMYDNPQKFHEF